ncbi:MAG: hypothetical protein ACR2IK_10065 [Chloroflexota bacterium]
MPDTPERFHPLRLGSEASLNRTCIAHVPGADPNLVGRPAFDVLSLGALGQITSSSEEVATIYGTRVAHLIATLLAPAQRGSGTSAWRAAYLRHWMTVEQVWLGGGIVSRLGPGLLRAVRAELGRLGVQAASVDIAPHAQVLPLIGLARTRPAMDGRTVVIDFGHTAVKRGIASIDGGRLVQLDLLASIPAPNAEHALEFVLDCLAVTIRTAQSLHANVHERVRVSLATYVSRGRPADPRSMYAVLGSVSRKGLQHDLQRRTRAPVRVNFVHDGTAAGRALTDHRRAGVIMLGTALGVGFVAPPSSLLPMSSDLVVG